MKLVITGMVAAGLALAQPPGRFGNRQMSPAEMTERRVQILGQQLSLTDTQKDQAKSIFTKATDDEAAVREDLKSAQEALTAAIKKNDDAGIDAAAKQIGTLTTKSTVIQAKANSAFYQLLTVEQRENFQPAPGGLVPPGRLGQQQPGAQRGRR